MSRQLLYCESSRTIARTVWWPIHLGLQQTATRLAGTEPGQNRTDQPDLSPEGGADEPGTAC
jgi:hypothetical protein